MSQADEYRNCTGVFYPGFHAEGPSPPPVQNGKPVSITAALDSSVSCNMDALQKRGVAREFQKLIGDKRLKDFLRDAFWWFFLEYFVSVDFDALLSTVKSNTLVSELEMAAFAFEGVVPVYLHNHTGKEDEQQKLAELSTLPQIKPNLIDKTGAPRHEVVSTEVALGLKFPIPPHLCGIHCENRHADVIAVVGSPRVASAMALANSIHGRAGRTSPSGDFGKSTSQSLSMTRSRSPMSARDGGDNSDNDDACSTSSAASSVISTALSVSRFPTSNYVLHSLPPHVRLQVAAKEQHQLFTRMASNYKAVVLSMLPLHFAVKDAVSRLLPDILAQAVFYLFCRSMPYAMKLLGPDVQLGIGQYLSFWIGGVQRNFNVLNWPIHSFLDPTAKKKRRASRHSIVHRRKSSHMNSQSILAKLAEQVSKIGSPRNGTGSQLQSHENTNNTNTTASNVKVEANAVRTSSGENLARKSSSRVKHFASPDGGGAGGVAVPTSTMTRTISSIQSPKSALRVIIPNSNSSADKAPATASSGSGLKPSPPPTAHGGSLTEGGVANNTPKSRPNTGAHISSSAGGPFVTDSIASLQGAPTIGTSSGETAAAEMRKALLVKQDVDAMRTEMMKMRTTHTFSQYHYTGTVTRQATAQATSTDEGSNLPKRIAQSYVVTTGKRNVQVIKKELDERFREQLPWYCKQDDRVSIRDSCSRSTTFSLSNWSPLMHRQMLASGEDNKATPIPMFWTVVTPR